MPRWPKGDGFWYPSPKQIAVLAYAAQDPSLSKADLAEKAGIGLATIYRWHADPKFRRWWSDELTELARTFRGPALLELMAIIQNPKVRSDRKTNAVKTLLEAVGGADPGKATAVLALMQAFQGSPPGTELRLASGTDQNGRPAIAGAVRKPDPEVLAVEQQGEQLGALRASVSIERTAARVSAQLTQPEQPEQRRNSAGAAPAPVSAVPTIPPAPQWKSERHPAMGEPASPPPGVPATVRDDALREGEGAGGGTDSEPSPLRPARTPLLNDHD